jgi:hypothetical protein
MKYANGNPGPDWGQTQKYGGIKLVHCLQYTCLHFTLINFYYLSGENFYKNNITHVNMTYKLMASMKYMLNMWQTSKNYLCILYQYI